MDEQRGSENLYQENRGQEVEDAIMVITKSSGPVVYEQRKDSRVLTS